ncbi:MAG: recombinase family protein [Armatimonadetes bacterium]|nr:recombinase family protein [Armatimonadota bacterium]
MHLPSPTSQGVDKFKSLYFQTLGIQLSDSEALEFATRTLHFVYLATHPPKCQTSNRSSSTPESPQKRTNGKPTPLRTRPPSPSPTHEIVKDAHSAKEPGRPRFDEIIARIDRGEVGGLIAWHPDRISRNEMDAAAICFRLRKKVLAELHFINYFFHNSPEGIMMLQIALSQSQYTSSKLSADIKRGMQHKVKKGWFPHRAPLGYVNDKHKDQGERTISIDPERFPLLRRAWEELLTGAYTVPHGR